MQRYIARYLPNAKLPAEERQKITTFPGVSVVDGSSRMLLIEATSATADALTHSFADWQVSPERSYSVPDTRLSVQNG